MRMIERQVVELKKKFEAMVNIGSCMDCDDHPDEKLDGYCSETHRAEGYAGIIVGLCDELFRYRALAKKHALPEPRADEASWQGVLPNEEEQGKALAGRLANLKQALGVLRDEHETTAGGEYHRCGCDLCTAHRQLEDPNIEIQRLTEDNELLQEALEEESQQFSEGLVNGDKIRVTLTRAIGYFSKNVYEMAEVIRRALALAKKDTKFKAFYDERVSDSRRRSLAAMKDTKKLNEQVREATESVENLSERIEEVERGVAGLKGAKP